ncbi:hypothetical protein KKC04_04795 [Patescibacteria group bacterium]|nr:hypothetical protein [Patescibacteria group bacterium]
MLDEIHTDPRLVAAVDLAPYTIRDGKINEVSRKENEVLDYLKELGYNESKGYIGSIAIRNANEPIPKTFKIPLLGFEIPYTSRPKPDEIANLWIENKPKKVYVESRWLLQGSPITPDSVELTTLVNQLSDHFNVIVDLR